MGHLTTLRRFAATGKIPFHAIVLASLIVSVCGIIEGKRNLQLNAKGSCMNAKYIVHATFLRAATVTVKQQNDIRAGDPPIFLPDGPEDQFVFEVDDDGDPVSLIFHCPVIGSGPPSITWSVIYST